MSVDKKIDPATIQAIAQNMFRVLPMLRKRMLRLDLLQSQYGIPLSHAQVLMMLNDSGSMSVSEISKRLGIAKPNITPLVDRLISSGLVDRVRDTEDRRVVNVVILEAGREKLAAIQQSISEQVEQWEGIIQPEEFEEMERALASITRILNATNV